MGVSDQAPPHEPRHEPLHEAIARLLGLPPETFYRAAGTERRDVTTVALLAGLLAVDPQFLRIAQAFLDVQDPVGRRAIANTVESIARTFAPPAARGDG